MEDGWPEELFSTAWRLLEQRRQAEMEDAGDLSQDHFYVQVRGGDWTVEHKHVAYDAVSGQARSGLPKEFCVAYGIQSMVSFSVAKYGDRDPSVLARAWCHKMEFFYAIWSEQDNWHYVFQGADHVAYIPTDEYTEFFLALTIDDIAAPGAAQIQNIAPGAPLWEVIPE